MTNRTFTRFCLTAISAAVAAVISTQTTAQTIDANNSIIFGQSAYTGSTGSDNASLGTSAGQGISGNFNNNLGGATGMSSTGSFNTSIGFTAGTIVQGNRNIAIGLGALNAGTAVPLGAIGAGVTPFGSGAGGTFTGSDNIVFGTNAAVTNPSAGTATNDTVVIGHTAQAQVSGAVALGSNSVANRAAGVAGYIPSSATVAQTAAITATNSTAGGVSVGDPTNSIYRQITGVAAGSADSDAVNVAQLKATLNGSALGLVQQTGGAPGNGQITVGAATGGTSVSFAGTSGDRVLSGVASGVANNDAVNVGQLNAGLSNTLTQANNYTDARITTAVTTANKYFQANSTGAAAAATGTDAVAIGPGTTTAGNASIAGGANAQASGSNTVAFGANANGAADNSVALGAGAQANRANSVALGAGATTGRGAQTYTDPFSGANRSSTGEVSVGAAGAERQVTNVADGSAATDAVNVRQLQASAASTLSQANAYTDTRAAQTLNQANSYTDAKAVSTLSQANTYTDTKTAATLVQANTYTDNRVGQAVAVNNTNNYAAPSATGKNSVALGPGSVASRDNSVSFGEPGAERQLTNVAAGTADTDAVNVGQARGMASSATQSANAYTDEKVNALEQRTKKQMAGVGAMAMAAAALQPNARAEGNFSVSAAAGTYGGESALAAGVNYHVSNQVLVNARVSVSSAGPARAGAAIGVTWGF